MAILGSDTFDRTANTILGGNWTEQVGGAAPALTTNMGTDGTSAIIEAVGFHGATLGGTTATDHFVQCWVRSPASNNIGILWRYVDIDNFYFIQMTPVIGNGTIIRKRTAGVLSTLANPTHVGGNTGYSLFAANTWTRVAIRHVGNRIQLYFQNVYETANSNEGPVIDVTDLTPILGSGPAGLISTGNTLAEGVNGGANRLKWNDFIAYSGSNTIYVDTAFNGGVAGEGMGTAARPDLGINYALNNAGTERGSTIKIVSTADIAPPSTNGYRIGHESRWNQTGYTFPTYDDANGQITDAGTPNLTIEGRDGGQSVFLENLNGVYFNQRSDARGIVYRGVRFRLTGGISSRVLRAEGVTDCGWSIAKCQVDVEAAISAPAVVVISGASARARATLNYFRNTVANYVAFIGGLGVVNIDALSVRMNVFDGRAAAMANTGATGCVGFASTSGPNVGDTWDLDHNTYLEVRSTGTSDNALGFAAASDVDGVVEFQNNILYGQANPNEMGHGVFIAAGAITGSVNAHHNGYFRVLTPRAAQVTNGGNEEDSADPAFVDPAASFAWQHTAGQGLLGEGTFAAIVIVGDFRPTSSLYVDTADDSNPLLGILDRGALQGFVLPPEPPSPSVPVPVPVFIRGACPPDYCVKVTYDPGGMNLDLSNDLMEARPITQEKDIELRSYRANDIDLVIKDPNGRFILGHANSIIEDAQGVPDWLSTPVTLEIVFHGMSQHIYRGFLIGVGARIGVADLRLGNRFESFVRKPVLANASGQSVSTDGATGSQFDPPDSGSYLRRVIPNLTRGCRIETWEFRFLNATQFEVKGSVTGSDGTGSTAATFVSNSGSITVSVAFWVGVFAANDKVTVKTTLRIENTTTIQLLKTMLTSPLGAGLAASDLDPSIDAYAGTAIDQPVFRYVLDSPTTVLEALENIGLHMLATVIEKANAKIGLSAFVPRLSMAPLDVLCSGADLMDLAIDTAPFYNFFVAHYDWDEADQEFTEGASFPADPDDNDSRIRYGRLIPAPRELNLRAFNDTNTAWIQSILNQSYVRWSIPRPLHKVKLKVERMNMELDDLYVLDSLVPQTRRAVEPYKIGKDIDGVTVDADLASADWYLQGPTECGYAFADVGHRVDDCWFVF